MNGSAHTDAAESAIRLYKLEEDTMWLEKAKEAIERELDEQGDQ